MNKNIKYLALSFILAIGIFLTAFTVKADTAPTFSVGKIDDAVVGDIVDVPIYLSNFSGQTFNSIALDITYDDEILEFSMDDVASTIKKLQFKSLGGAENGHYQAVVARTDGMNKQFSGDEVVILSFEVKKAGKADISISSAVLGYDSVGNGDDVTTIPSEVGTSGYISVPVALNSVSVTENMTLDLSKDSEKEKTISVVADPVDTTVPADLSFSSSNEDVAKVNSNGKVTAVGIGSAVITVNAYGETKPCNVTVKASVTALNIAEPLTTTLVIDGTDSVNLSASLVPSVNTETDKTIVWTSSNTSAAVVDQTGKVTAVGVGTTTITAKLNGRDDIFDTVSITVKKPFTTASVSPTSITMGKDETKTITVTLDGEYKTIEWSSNKSAIVVTPNASDKKIASVTATGSAEGNVTVVINKGKSTETTLTVPVKVTQELQSISVDKTDVVLGEGQSVDVTMTATPVVFDGDQTVTWTSNDNGVATVVNGKITAVSEGSCVITVKVQEKTAMVNVTVKKNPEGITISETSVNKIKGDAFTLGYTINPVGALSSGIKWESSNTSVAVVDQSGNVTAVGGGTATITVSVDTPAGVKSSSCEVTVKVPATDISISMDDLDKLYNIEKGDVFNIETAVLPEDTTDEILVVSNDTSKVEVKKVSKYVWEIKAVGKGSTSLKVTAGAKSRTIPVTVKVSVKKVTISNANISDGVLTIHKGKDETLNASINPDDADYEEVKWEVVTGKDVVSIDTNGKVTAKKVGEAEVKVTVGGKSATLKVVVDSPVTVFNASETTIDVNRKEIKDLMTEAGVTIGPEDCTEDTTITWTSSNEAIATVDKNGNVKGIAEGTVVITGKLNKTLEKKEINITVNVKLIQVDDVKFLDDDDEEVLEGDLPINAKNIVLVPTYYPFNATETENGVWASSDPTVLSVDPVTGVLTPVSEGTATISYTLNGHVASMEITVFAVPLEGIMIKNDLSDVRVNDEFDLSIKLDPVDATDELTYEFESSDINVLTVDEDGHVKVVGKGRATIKVTVTNQYGDEFTDTYEVNVTQVRSPETATESIIKYVLGLLVLIASGFTTVRKLRQNN